MTNFALRCLGSLMALAGVALLVGGAAASNPGTESPQTTPATNAATRADAAQPVAAPPAKDVTPEARARAGPSVSYLSGEIVKMAEAGVGTGVIQAYVERSTTAYPPSAEEIVYLHEHGIRAEVVTALIQRSSELRARAEQAAREGARLATQPAPSAPAPAIAQQPAYVYPTQPQYVTYANSYPNYVYVDYPTWGCVWPSVWWWGGFDYRPGWRYAHWPSRQFYAPVRGYPRYGPWVAAGGHFGGRFRPPRR
jgi:hypothetical protein